MTKIFHFTLARGFIALICVIFLTGVVCTTSQTAFAGVSRYQIIDKSIHLYTSTTFTSPGHAPSVPQGQPGAIRCIAVALTTVNRGGYVYQITLGLTNFCSTSLTNIQWNITGTIFCISGQTGPGINVSGSFSYAGKGSIITLYNASRSSLCLLNGVSTPNSEVFNSAITGALTNGNTGLGQSTVQTLDFPL
jgi:hypothetical protein